jgi:hypothetical protein
MIDNQFPRLGAVAFIILSLAGATAAEAGPQEDAEGIAQGIEGFLSLVSDQNQAIGLHHDKVSVSPDGSAFAVAITGMRFGAGDAGLGFGEIDYRLEPQPDGTYKVGDLKLAKQMPIIDPDGKPAGTLSFETTAFSGLWSSKLQSFLTLDWQAKDVVATALEGLNGSVRIAQATIDAQGKDAGNGHLEEAVTYTFSDLAVTDPNGEALKVGKVGGQMILHAFDFAGYRAQMAKLRDLTAKYAVQGGAQPPTLNDSDRADVAAVAQALPGLIAGYEFRLAVDDASAGSEGSVRHGEVGIAMTGLAGDAATINLHLKQDGLTVSDANFATPLGQALFPKSFDLNVSLDQVPLASATESLAQSMTTSAAMADPISLFMMTMMSAVGNAPLSMKIAPSTIESTKGRVAFDGSLAMTNGAPFGKINVTATGLAEIAALAGAALKDDPDAQGILGALHQVQAAAQHATGVDGKPVDKFLLELTPSGQAQVNGQPLSGF